MSKQASDGLTVTLPSDLEIEMTQVFDAPRELVFEAMTKCEHITKWWGPRGTELTCELDFRPGGSYRFVQHAPDGQEYAFRGEIREIAPPERVVQTFEFEGMPGHIAVETVVLEEKDGRTTVTSTSVYQSKDDRDGIIASGMEAGAAESYERLGELLATLA
jgi:uncharacterized protein YndB with AHSA1/START domain